MTTFQFETITAQQAQGISQFDTVTFAGGSANRATVTYGLNSATIKVGDTSVVFGPFITTVSANGNLEFSDGSKLFIGDAAANNVTLGALNDAMFGGDGNDALNAGEGANLLQGNAGTDTLTGGGGADTFYGGQGDDRIVTGAGSNASQGNLGNDTILAGASLDTVRGGQGDDSIDGGSGNDWLSGDLGADTITGGLGADIFHSFNTAGVDRITDFSVGQGDKVLLDSKTIYTTAQVGADTVIDMGAGNQVILVGVSMATLTAGTIVVG